MLQEMVCTFLMLTVAGVANAAGEGEMASVSEVESMPARGTLETRAFYSSTLNRDYGYGVYLPADYTAEEHYPVIYLLHGRGDTMAGWGAAIPVLDALIDENVIPPVLAVMPDVPSSNRGSYYVDSRYAGQADDLLRAEAVETAFFSDFVPHIDETFSTIPDRTARVIGGYSMGGFGATRYALAHADTFGAALVLSPAVYTPLPPQESSARELGAFGSGDELFDPERYRELNYQAALQACSGGLAPLKVYIAVGDDEYKHPRPEDALHDLDMEAHLLFNRLVRVNGVDAEFRVFDGGHDWKVWKQGFADGLTYLKDHLRLSRFSWSADA